MPWRALLLFIVVGCLSVVGCGSQTPPAPSGVGPSSSGGSPPAELYEASPAVAAREDFFGHVNDRYFARHPIPADQTAWGVDFELIERNQTYLKAICDELLADNVVTGVGQQIRDFYAEAMDEGKLQREGIKPLKPELDAIAGITSIESAVPVIAQMHRRGAWALFGPYVAPDKKDAEHYAVYLYQGGTALPERDYYLADDADSKRIRAAYAEHLKKMFVLAGETADEAGKSAATVLAIETKLADAQWPPAKLQDPEPQYNKTSRAALAKLAPGVPWDAYFAALGRADVGDVIVGQPDFLRRVSDVLKGTSIAELKTYLRWCALREAAAKLSDPFVNESFEFFGKTLNGAKEIRPRWKRTIEAIDDLMGEALGRLYVERHFPPGAKERIDRLVDNVVAAFADRIKTRDWMTPATRDKALAKLVTVRRKLGYPAKWRDYSKLAIGRDSYLANAHRASAFEFDRRLARLKQPVDHAEWDTSPPTVNAYYSESDNDITFPAGILQPPFFDAHADDAVNYGAIGAIIGHELTHGFDDAGRKFDARGNMVEWWTEADKAKYAERTKRLVAQFNACVAIEDLHVNGELTLNENIADLGGLRIAYAAYRRSLMGSEPPAIGGLTGDQRFFVSYAISWRTHYRPERLKTLIRTDEHAPPRFRVNVPLSNFAPFYEAFGIQPGDGMYRPPAEWAEIW